MRGKIARRRTLGPMSLLATVLALAGPAAPPAAHALPAGFEKFYGDWVGTAVADASGEIAPRDIRAKIAPQGDGFSITWVLVIHKGAGKDKKSEVSIAFQPTQRGNIYASAMRVDSFGNAVPHDPLKGDPYMWANLDGATLVIHALVITEGGGYEMHTYERTITPAGVMSLKYTRVRDGALVRPVTGTLKRAK